MTSANKEADRNFLIGEWSVENALQCAGVEYRDAYLIGNMGCNVLSTLSARVCKVATPIGTVIAK